MTVEPAGSASEYVALKLQVSTYQVQSKRGRIGTAYYELIPLPNTKLTGCGMEDVFAHGTAISLCKQRRAAKRLLTTYRECTTSGVSYLVATQAYRTSTADLEVASTRSRRELEAGPLRAAWMISPIQSEVKRPTSDLEDSAR